MHGCFRPDSTLISSWIWSICAMLRKLLASTDLMATVSPAGPLYVDATNSTVTKLNKRRSRSDHTYALSHCYKGVSHGSVFCKAMQGCYVAALLLLYDF